MSGFHHKTDVAIFMHIPKTAGTTLNNLVWRHYEDGEVYIVDPHTHTPEALCLLPTTDKQKIQLVTGHIHFGIHQSFERKAQYFTILRHPVALVLSYYHYLRKRKDHPHHSWSHHFDLPEFIASWQDMNVHNIQTRHIAGIGTYDPESRCTPADLERAKENLKNHFLSVGLTERFDEYLLLLGQQLGWTNLFYAKMNTTGKRPTRQEISTELRQTIEQANALDLELYAYAQQLFEAQLAQQGTRFAKRVASYQWANRIRTPFLTAYWRGRESLIVNGRKLKQRLFND